MLELYRENVAGGGEGEEMLYPILVMKFIKTLSGSILEAGHMPCNLQCFCKADIKITVHRQNVDE